MSDVLTVDARMRAVMDKLNTASKIAIPAGGILLFGFLTACGVSGVPPTPAGHFTDQRQNVPALEVPRPGESDRELSPRTLELIKKYLPNANSKEILNKEYLEFMTFITKEGTLVELVNLSDYLIDQKAVQALANWAEQEALSKKTIHYVDGQSSYNFKIEPRDGNKVFFLVNSVNRFPDSPMPNVSAYTQPLHSGPENITSTSFIAGPRSAMYGVDEVLFTGDKMDLTAWGLATEFYQSFTKVDSTFLQEVYANSRGMDAAGRGRFPYHKYKSHVLGAQIGVGKGTIFDKLPISRDLYDSLPNRTLLIPKPTNSPKSK